MASYTFHVAPATYTFTTEEEPVEFPHRIYPMYIRSIRDADAAEGDLLLKRWTEGLDAEWAATDARIRSLATLVDPETCPTAALTYLKDIVGLTRSLDGMTGRLSEAELRQLIAIAVRIWKFKGTGKGLVDALRAITGNVVRYLTWFFYRIILGEFELGHVELDVDPWLLDQPGAAPWVTPDSVDVGLLVFGDVLPSAADPAWTYVSEGKVEGDVFYTTADFLNHAQDIWPRVPDGGRYIRDDPTIRAADAAFGARWQLVGADEIGGHPWHVQLEDGTRGYRLAWSDGAVVAQDAGGATVAGPRSIGIGESVWRKFRIVKRSTGTVDFTLDGVSIFGELDATAFAASANKRYSFGYFNEGRDQDWLVRWVDVGPRPWLRFDLSALLGLEEAVPHDVRVRYLPTGSARTVRSYWTGSRNECRVDDAFGVPIPLDDVREVSTYLVGLDPDEFVSDLRVVDDGSLDREFVSDLVAVVRPAGERIFVRFIDFQDDFRSGDLRYWTVVSGTVAPDGDAGVAVLEDPGEETFVLADSPRAPWSSFTATAKLSLRDVDAGKWGEIRFMYVDADNFYAIRINPDVRTVVLDEVVAGVRSTLATHGPMDVWHPGVAYTVHVQTEIVDAGANVLIKFFLDGNFLDEVRDASILAGGFGVAVEVGQELTLELVDLYSCPYPYARVGPPPDAAPDWEHTCETP